MLSRWIFSLDNERVFWWRVITKPKPRHTPTPHASRTAHKTSTASLAPATNLEHGSRGASAPRTAFGNKQAVDLSPPKVSRSKLMTYFPYTLVPFLLSRNAPC